MILHKLLHKIFMTFSTNIDKVLRYEIDLFEPNGKFNTQF